MMMDRKKIALSVLAKISGKSPEALTPTVELVADLGIDSPRALELLVELEEKLEIEISDEAAAKMDTVGDVLQFVEALP